MRWLGVARASFSGIITRHSSSRSNTVTIQETQSSQQKVTVAGGQLPTRAPLAKNFFVGLIDTELLGYPEVLSRDELAKLQNEELPFREFYSTQADELSIDAARTTPLLEQLHRLGSYATNVPMDFDGKGWGWTQSLYAAESETNCPDLALGLLLHRAVVDLLREKGTVQQQNQYLPKLAKGELVASEAIHELDVPEDDYFNTTASYDPNSQMWILNGSKAFVITAPLSSGSAHLFVVIAQTQQQNMKGDIGRSSTLFLVESTTPGVKLGEQHHTLGFRGMQMRNLHFDAVQLPESCVIGQAHAASAEADILLRSGRLRSSLIAMGLSKRMLSGLAQYCKGTKQCGVMLKDVDMTKTNLSKAMCATYGMESMVYMTAGMLDEFEQQDVNLEAALVKYYALTRTFKLAAKCVDIVGPKSLQSGEKTELNLRNAIQLCAIGESVDALRMYIALTGLQHAGLHLNETVRKSRNPLFHPTHIFGKYLQSANIDAPKVKVKLGEYLHPTLDPAAQCIEQSIARLKMCTELLLTQYGSQIVEKHSEMMRVAEMSTTIYCMFCSAARASRSYCIGLPLADHELLTATSICSHGSSLVHTLAKEIFGGHYANNDNNLQRLSRQVVNSGYFATHPLTFNF